MHRWVSSLLGPALCPSLGSAWAQHSGQPRPAQGIPLGAVTEYRYNHCHKSKIEIIHRYRIVTIPPTPRCTLCSINSRSRYPIGRARSEGQSRERESTQGEITVIGFRNRVVISAREWNEVGMVFWILIRASLRFFISSLRSHYSVPFSQIVRKSGKCVVNFSTSLI